MNDLGKPGLIKKLGMASCLLAALLLTAPAEASNNSASAPMRDSCVLIDNDYDIDDMMAIPLVIGNRYVAAIIQSEGYTLPEQSAPAVHALVNHLSDQPGDRQIPIIVGAKQSPPRDPSNWAWLPFFRAMMNQSNALLPTAPTPWPSDPAYAQKVVDAVSDCKNVSVLILGSYTSFINYSPLIRDKIDRVVLMGQPTGDDSRTPGRESFNCNYDLQACQTAMTQLQGLNAYFVDIPRDNGDDANLPKHACLGLTPSPNCYNPSFEMVAGGSRSTGLLDSGLPGRLKQALSNPINCNDKFTAGMPSIPSAPESQCSALSTWVPANVAAGPGGEMLLWDQTAALFLVKPDAFSLYYPPENPALGGKHWEPTLVNNSYSETVEYLRKLWTEFTNNAAQPRN
jgi:hypothetical protein